MPKNGHSVSALQNSQILCEHFTITLTFRRKISKLILKDEIYGNSRIQGYASRINTKLDLHNLE